MVCDLALTIILERKKMEYKVTRTPSRAKEVRQR